MSRTAIRFVAQFAVLYGLVSWLCATQPVYPQVERVVAWLADATLALSPDEALDRALWLERSGEGHDDWVYRYDVEMPGRSWRLQFDYHKHGFIVVLFLTLALSTPRVGWAARGGGLLLGGALVFALMTGMLLGDLTRFESKTIDGDGPFPLLNVLMRGMHRTAAAGLTPLVIWGFFAAGPLLREFGAGSGNSDAADA